MAHLCPQLPQLSDDGLHALRLLHPPVVHIPDGSGALCKQRGHGQGHGRVGDVVAVVVDATQLIPGGTCSRCSLSGRHQKWRLSMAFLLCDCIKMAAPYIPKSARYHCHLVTICSQCRLSCKTSAELRPDRFWGRQPGSIRRARPFVPNSRIPMLDRLPGSSFVNQLQSPRYAASGGQGTVSWPPSHCLPVKMRLPASPASLQPTDPLSWRPVRAHVNVPLQALSCSLLLSTVHICCLGVQSSHGWPGALLTCEGDAAGLPLHLGAHEAHDLSKSDVPLQAL